MSGCVCESSLMSVSFRILYTGLWCLCPYDWYSVSLFPVNEWVKVYIRVWGFRLIKSQIGDGTGSEIPSSSTHLLRSLSSKFVL